MIVRHTLGCSDRVCRNLLLMVELLGRGRILFKLWWRGLPSLAVLFLWVLSILFKGGNLLLVHLLEMRRGRGSRRRLSRRTLWRTRSERLRFPTRKMRIIKVSLFPLSFQMFSMFLFQQFCMFPLDIWWWWRWWLCSSTFALITFFFIPWKTEFSRITELAT